MKRLKWKSIEFDYQATGVFGDQYDIQACGKLGNPEFRQSHLRC